MATIPVRKAMSELVIRRMMSPTLGNAPVAMLRTDRTPTEKAQDSVRDAKEWMKDKREEAMDKTRDAKEFVKDKTRDATEYTKDKARDVKEWVQDKTGNSPSMSDMGQKAREGGQRAAECATDATRQAADKAREAGHEAKQWAKKKSRTTEGHYRDDEGLKTAQDKSTLEKMGDKVKQAGEKVSETLAEGARKIGLKKD